MAQAPVSFHAERSTSWRGGGVSAFAEPGAKGARRRARDARRERRSGRVMDEVVIDAGFHHGSLGLSIGAMARRDRAGRGGLERRRKGRKERLRKI